MLIFLTMIDSEEGKSKFETIYYKYRYLMFYLAKEILNNDKDAEDAVQESFIKIIDHLDTINIEDCHKTKSLIVIITRSVAIDMYRKNKREMNVPLDDTVIEMNNYNKPINIYMEAAEVRADLAICIAKLPDRFRDVIILKYYHEYTNSEIAKIINTSETNIRKLLERARKKLSEEYSL